jgi:hypothetical protein
MVNETQYHVFLSHNSADKPAVEEIAQRLIKAGLQPWLDKWNLIPGEPWQEAIEEALDSCATCAVFVGPSGIGPWQNEEMRAQINRRVSEGAASGGKPFRVIPRHCHLGRVPPHPRRSGSPSPARVRHPGNSAWPRSRLGALCGGVPLPGLAGL